MEKGERVTDPHHQIPRIEQWAFEFTKVYLGVMMKTLASLTRLGGGTKIILFLVLKTNFIVFDRKD